MNWIALSYTLAAAKGNSSARVALWRRLRRLGAISTAGGLQILPARADCMDAFQRLAQEIRQDGGEALTIQVEEFEGITGQQLVGLFCEARHKDYADLSVELDQIELSDDLNALETTFTRLRKQFNELRRIDYFNCPEGILLEKRLDSLERRLLWGESPSGELTVVSREHYQGRQWVTRPQPHVDRLSSIWLIRRFIDPQAVFRYDTHIQAGEVGFDMPGGEFTHHGSLCTFETLIQVFNLVNDPGLAAVAAVVHEIDLHDGQYDRPETPGVEAVLQGWLLAGLSDSELEQQGNSLFSGLYAALSYQIRS